MPSPRWMLLAAKEFRELLASRAYWLLLLMIGPLVGQAFISAVNLYNEVSGGGGGPAALPQGLSPLDGILVPSFGAYDLAVTLLFPFVAIRLVAAEKESGALKLMLQAPASVGSALAVKGVVIFAGWLIAWTPGVIALALWKSYGGHLHAPELLNLLAGHALRVILSAGIAVAAAAVCTGAATAAIVTLGFTVGTWALEFIAVGRGGLLQEAASYTPTAALRVFEQGQLRFGTVIVLLAMGVGGFALAAVWLPTGRGWRFRLLGSLGVGVAVALVALTGSTVRATRDLSENRRNSFSASDEAALREIKMPLRITVYLAPEDPRLTDLERGIIGKLRLILPRVDVEYAAQSVSGLFETGEDHYGEVWYTIGGSEAMSRSTTEPIVLEELYHLAGIQPPAPSEEPAYPGYPLAARPRNAALIFYALWPLMVCAVWWVNYKQ
ncbi:MAG TPA: ABC transporter permease subunit [Blastocatellia bacterium]|nr:ABC transporter permease subunit [Blastocatellia bacterium]